VECPEISPVRRTPYSRAGLYRVFHNQAGMTHANESRGSPSEDGLAGEASLWSVNAVCSTLNAGAWLMCALAYSAELTPLRVARFCLAVCSAMDCA
jgi:hypothetical protein